MYLSQNYQIMSHCMYYMYITCMYDVVITSISPQARFNKPPMQTEQYATKE